MLDYQKFINQQIVNKEGQTGKVVAFTKERITIEIGGVQKLFNPEIAFKCGAIKFVDDSLNQLVNQDINKSAAIKEAKQQKVEKIHKEAQRRNKRAIQRYKELCGEANLLQQVFGKDFIYPPLVEFEKKYPYVIAEALEDESWAATWRRVKHMDCKD